jgi:hypothetical protein
MNMDLHEKQIRCLAVEHKYIDEDTIDCRVFSRWVRDCADCSFSYITRPSLGRIEQCT